MQSQRYTSRRIFIWSIVAVLALLALGFALRAADSSALWKIVHDDCVPTQQRRGLPGRCQLVDLAGHYAVLKDRNGNTHFLLLPTDRITGIESPALLVPGAHNYWQAAWQARHFVQERAGAAIGRDLIGLSINSARRRSQNQLHIHIDCVEPQLHAALMAHEAQIGAQWSERPLLLAGHDYFAVKIRAADLDAIDAFRLLDQRLSDPASQMADQVLSVVGAQFSDGAPGFYVLDSPAGEHGATSDVVLDRSCSVAKATMRSGRQ
jgi:CDP-diacylglycerol pyrophosphatase